MAIKKVKIGNNSAIDINDARISEIASTVSSSGKNPVTGEAVANYVSTQLGNLAGALLYKGTIGTGGTITTLPASHSVGDTYVVKTAGTYAGKACEVGDMIICNVAGSSANNDHWTVVNGENQVTNKGETLAWGTSKTIATVDGTDITVSLPLNPNTDTSVTSASNHYSPSADNSAELTGTLSGTAGSYAKDTEYTVLTGVKAQRDAKGHVTGITYTAQKIKDTNTDTDTKVTSAANHYTPTRDTDADKSASASGATAAWSIDVVKGVTVQTDGKGHVTGVAVTSGKIPGNPNTDRYVNSASFAQDTTNNNVKMTLTRAGSDSATVTGNIPAASTSAYGVTKLSSATNSTSEALAATPAAVKAAYDLAASKTSNTGTITSVGNTTSGAVTVSSSNNTASFGSAVTVGSVGGVDLKFTMPSNPDTNTAQLQVSDTSNKRINTKQSTGNYIQFTGGTNKFTVGDGTNSFDVGVTPSISNNVTYSGTLTGNQVATFDGTSGAIKASGYTIATSVPSGAVFTDTNTKVTSVSNHYTPTTNADSALSASATGATAAWGIDVVKGVTLSRDAAGHVTGVSVTSGKIPSNPNTDRYVNSASFADDTTSNASSPVKMTLTRAGSDTTSVTANIPKVSSSSAGVVPKGASVSSQSQSTKFLREDGTWAAPSYTTNTNTHYTATPVLGGSTATSNATTATANDATYMNIVENGAKSGGIQIKGSGATSVSAKDGIVTISSTDNNTTYGAGTGLSLSGTTFNHSNSVTAGTAKGDDNKTLTFGGTFTVPSVTYDAQGHITSKSTTTMTMPANPNTDTKVTQVPTTSSNTSWRPVLIGQSYSDAAVFAPTSTTDTVLASHLAKFAPSTGVLAVVGLNKMGTDGKVASGSNTQAFNTNGGVTTFLTSHQDISGKADKSATVSTVTYDTTNKKLTKTINGSVTDVVTASTIVTDGGGIKSHQDISGKANLASPAFTGTPTAPTASAGTNTTQIATTAFVKTEIDSVLQASDAMRYKGTLGTGGTITALPNSHSQGDTYKVITAGTYAGKACEIGDMIICLADGTSANNDHWTVVQANIDGAVTGPSSAVASRIAVFDGTSGKVIKDSGYTIATSVPSGAVFTDTNTWRPVSDSVSSTSSSDAASSKAVKTAYDLAASKTANTGTVTSVATGVGLTGGSITTSGTVKAKLKDETANTADSSRSTSSNGGLYSVEVDKSGNLAVRVPWENSTYTVNNGSFTVKGAGTAVSSTSANASSNTAVDIVAGSNVTVTPDATNGKITIASTDTNTWRPLGTGASDACAGNDSRLSNARTPVAHATNSTTYGAGTTTNYGHVKTQTGDMNGTSSTDGIAAGLGHTHSQYLTSHQSVSSSNPTASWGSAVTVGSVGGTDLKFTMPSNPNTNTWNAVSSTVDGYVPKTGTAAASTISTQSTEWVLTTTSGASPTWRKLPSTAFNVTITYNFSTNGNGTLDVNGTSYAIAPMTDDTSIDDLFTSLGYSVYYVASTTPSGSSGGTPFPPSTAG